MSMRNEVISAVSQGIQIREALFQGHFTLISKCSFRVLVTVPPRG
jgi:hypothetical protein